MTSRIQCTRRCQSIYVYNLWCVVITRWFNQCFASTLPDHCLEGVWDRLVGGCVMILVIVAVAILLTHLQEKTSWSALLRSHCRGTHSVLTFAGKKPFVIWRKRNISHKTFASYAKIVYLAPLRTNTAEETFADGGNTMKFTNKVFTLEISSINDICVCVCPDP